MNIEQESFIRDFNNSLQSFISENSNDWQDKFYDFAQDWDRDWSQTISGVTEFYQAEIMAMISDYENVYFNPDFINVESINGSLKPYFDDGVVEWDFNPEIDESGNIIGYGYYETIKAFAVEDSADFAGYWASFDLDDDGLISEDEFYEDWNSFLNYLETSGYFESFEAFDYSLIGENGSEYFEQFDANGDLLIDEDEFVGDFSNYLEWTIDDGYGWLVGFDPYDEVNWQKYWRMSEYSLWDSPEDAFLDAHSLSFEEYWSYVADSYNMENYWDLEVEATITGFETDYSEALFNQFLNFQAYKLDITTSWIPSETSFDTAFEPNFNLDPFLNYRKIFDEFGFIFNFDNSLYFPAPANFRQAESMNYSLLRVPQNQLFTISTSANEIISGNFDAEIINAGDGLDIIEAGAGNDEINAERGDDILNGGEGNDLLNGGEGDDTYLFANKNFGHDVVIDDNGSIIVGNQLIAGIANKEKGYDYYKLGDFFLKISNGDLLIAKTLSAFKELQNEEKTALFDLITIKNFRDKSFGIDLNEAPETNFKNIILNEDVAIEIDLGANLNDGDGELVQIYSTTQTQNGLLSFDQKSGKAIYSPNQNFFGFDNFKFLAGDNKGAFIEQEMSIFVNSINDLPSAVNDDFAIDEDSALKINIEMLLANDSDVEDGDLRRENFILGVALYGRTKLNFDGTISYFAPHNFSGADQFHYYVKDSNGGLSNKGLVNIKVNPINDAPAPNFGTIIPTKSAEVGKEFIFEIDRGLFFDADSDNLTISIKNSDGSELPSWLVFEANNQILRGVPDVVNYGLNSFIIIASDGKEKAKINFEISVNKPLEISQSILVNPIFMGDGGEFVATISGSADIVFGGAGNDIIEFKPDQIWNNFATISYFAFNSYSGERIEVFGKSRSFDAFDGKDGDNDVLNLGAGDDAIFLDDSISQNPSALGNRFSGIEIINGLVGADIIDLSSSIYTYGNITLNGNDGDDVLWGNDGNDIINGDSGDDNIHGGRGDDLLRGGEGDDKIIGYDGNDIIIGGAGADIIDGQSGDDTISYEDSEQSIIVNLLQQIFSGGDAWGDVVRNIENIVGSSNNDEIFGDNGSNKIKGGNGDDVIYGFGGNDLIAGEKGVDVLIGGEGNDQFIFRNIEDSTNIELDAILDFVRGEDKIDVSGFGFNSIVQQANYGAVNSETLTFLEFYFDGSGNTIIDDPNSNFAIKLNGEIQLGASDFSF